MLDTLNARPVNSGVRCLRVAAKIESKEAKIMYRRQFIKNVGMCGIAFGMSDVTSFASSSKQPEVAITLDDFVVFDTPTLSGAQRNDAILNALREYRIKAGMFVSGKYVDNEKNMPLLRLWDDQGHLLANHTYSHSSYHGADLQKYEEDILRNERLLKRFSHYRKFLRFPFLKEGSSAEERDRMRALLKKHGYRNGHVTIDASDWYVDTRLRKRLKENPKADVNAYRDFYLNHIWDRATYYDDLSSKVLGRSIKHTLLLHHNVVNGLFLGDVLRMFVRGGWKLIDAEEAYTDPVFLRSPNTVPAGESIVWALAKETGKFDGCLRYPGESESYEQPKMDALGL